MTYEVKSSTTRDVLSSHSTLSDALQEARLQVGTFILATEIADATGLVATTWRSPSSAMQRVA